MEEARQLVDVGQDAFGREAQLAEDAAVAWAAMRRGAEREGVRLLLLSGFRSIEGQAEIVQKKLSAGQPLEAILRVSAYPGFREHHTGRAIDLGSPTCAHFSEAFGATREFDWLSQRAPQFGFTLSYPRGNPQGVVFEPWHWCLWEKAGREP